MADPQPSTSEIASPKFALRHFHLQSNAAAVVTVALAEFGIDGFDASQPGPELALHGMLQSGPYLEGRGRLLAASIRHLQNRGVTCRILHDASRTAAIANLVKQDQPEFENQWIADLGIMQAQPFRPEYDLGPSQAVILVESTHALGRLPLHLLLVRREGDGFQVMNSLTGRNHAVKASELAMHLNAPVHFKELAFAGGIYRYSGVAIQLGTD